MAPGPKTSGRPAAMSARVIEAGLEDRVAVVECADLERDRSRIDAGDARAQPSSFATS
jgi:hypothetical protein